MVRTILQQVKQYKKPSLLTPLFAALEVVMEVLIPLVTAAIVDEGIKKEDMRAVYWFGALMLLLAMCSLLFGILAGKYAAAASSGLACNLRNGMYENIQQLTECIPDGDSYCGTRSPYADLQYVYVPVYQRKDEYHIFGCHRLSGGISDYHYADGHENI